MSPSVFFPLIYRNSKSNNLFSWPRAGDFHFLSERVSHPIEQEKKKKRDGWMAQYTARQRRWSQTRSNLFNTVKEMTLRSKKCWISPQTANRNNGAVLIVTLQSSTQRAIRGGLIRGVERWKTVWKGHCTLYLEFLIFPAFRPLCKCGIKLGGGGEKEKVQLLRDYRLSG